MRFGYIERSSFDFIVSPLSAHTCTRAAALLFSSLVLRYEQFTLGFIMLIDPPIDFRSFRVGSFVWLVRGTT